MSREKKRRPYRVKSRNGESQYEKDINFFIPYAEDEAILRVTNLGRFSETRLGADGRKYRHCFKTQFFHEIMNRMTREAGLRHF